MVNKIDIKPATLISGSTVSVQILKYVDSALSEENTYTFDANDFEALASASNPYVAILNFGQVHSENINGSTTQLYFDGVVCSPNDAYTLATLVDADVTAYASGGGGYVFPSNSGNTAYISSDGNDSAGVIGNISKPYLTADAAILDLDSGNAGTLVILSASTTIEVNDYDYTSMPYSLNITVLCPASVVIGGSCSFGSLKINSLSEVVINTQLLCVADESIYINCGTLSVPSTSNGSIEYTGAITCNSIVVDDNANISIAADVIEWKKSASIGTIISFTYNNCNPKTFKGKLSQDSTNDPTIDAVYENSFNETFTTEYMGVGDYELRSSSAQFDPDKTRLFFGAGNYNYANQQTVTMSGGSASDHINIKTFDAFASPADTMIQGLDITIETYL